MAVRLRLRRMGKKKQPFYRIVAIDSRVQRDGKYLENIGTYNPVKDPAELSLQTDRALYWLGVGAQPSDTVRSLLRRTGVMLRWDLLKRGKTEDEIEAEFTKWSALQDEKVKRSEAAKLQAAKAMEAEKAAAKKEAEEAEKAESVAEGEAESAEPDTAEEAEEASE